MNDEPRIHDIVAGSLDRHARSVGTPNGDLGDVLRRVDRRRARRRSTAVIGSTLAVAAGAAGIMLVAAPVDAPAPGDGDPDANSAAAASWGCSGFLASDGTADYYAACEAFPFVVTPTMPVLPPATSVGATMVVFATTAPSAITVSPASTTTTTTTIPIREDQHVVVEGDSISGIAARYGVTPGDLVAFNGWADGIEHPLQIGDTVAVPYLIPTFPPATTAVSFAVSSPPVCESGLAVARVTVPCDSSQLPTTTTTTTTTMPLSAPGTAFRCNGPLGSDLAYTYYSSCEPVTWDAVPDPVVPTTAVFTPAFATTMPFATTITPSALTAPPVPAATCSTTTTVAGDISESEQTYTVVEGDYVSGIAETYGISACALVDYNAWPEGIEHGLFIGDVVRIPPGSRIP